MKVSTSSSVPLILLFLFALFLSPVCFGQLPSSRCDASESAIEACASLTELESGHEGIFTAKQISLDPIAVSTEGFAERSNTGSDGAAALVPSEKAGVSLACGFSGIVYFPRD